jgi:GntR family transcriptional regulator
VDFAMLNDIFGQKKFADLAKRSLEAIAASNEDAKCLGIRKGDPILLLRSIAYLGTGRPIEVYTARHRGDRSKFGVEVQKKFNS